MSIEVRCADLDQDREPIIDALRRFLTRHSTAMRYDWLYKSGPHGQACAWIAADTETLSVIGVAAAFPRQLWTGTGVAVAWVLGDFCLDERYRSLGPALRLQRACLNAASKEGVNFCYDFPSSSMLAVYRRLGIRATHRMVRMARPLRVDRTLCRLTRLPPVAKLLSPIGNRLLSFYYSRGGTDNRLIVEAHVGEFGEEFTALARRLHEERSMTVIRSATYLNWRYIRNPLYGYDVITARRDGELLGCGVFLQQDDDAILVDLFGVEDETVLGLIVSCGIEVMNARSVQTLSVAIAESHPWIRFMETQGFIHRDSSPMVIYVPRRDSQGSVSDIEKPWRLMHGDRDS
jgi:hypothetical protein